MCACLFHLYVLKTQLEYFSFYGGLGANHDQIVNSLINNYLIKQLNKTSIYFSLLILIVQFCF